MLCYNGRNEHERPAKHGEPRGDAHGVHYSSDRGGQSGGFLGCHLAENAQAAQLVSMPPVSAPRDSTNTKADKAGQRYKR
jgi:hypothetical protein